MTKYRVILNPAAGRGRGAHARAAVERALGGAGVVFDVVETTGPGDAIAFAHRAVLDGCDVVAVVGGDGTAHEAAQGLVRGAQATGAWDRGEPAGTLGIIPVGTGNDYAWRLGIPKNDPETACRLLLADRRRVVDLGHVTDEAGRSEFFHNHIGGGFEAATAIESLKIGKLSGLALYLTAVLRVIPQYNRAPMVTVRHNGTEQTRPILMASAANGGRSGGGFRLAPAALLDDGQLDLVLMHAPNVAVILWLLVHVLRATHIGQKRFVAMERTGEFVLEAPAGIPIHLDGEIFRADARRIEVRLLPSRLRVVAGTDR